MRRLVPAPSAADRGLVLLLVLLCGCLTVAATLTSLWLHTSADTMAAGAFDDAPHPATQLQVTYSGVGVTEVPPGAAQGVAEAVAPTLRSVLTAPRHAVVTTEMVPTVLPARPAQPSYLSVAGYPDAAAVVEVVAGRLPEPGSPVTALPDDVAAEHDGPARTPVVEVVLERSASAELGMPVGTWVTLSSPSYQGEVVRPAVLHVVGIFRAAEPYPSPLDDLDALRKPSISILPELNLVRATALAADEETVLGAQWEEAPDLRFSFDLAGSPTAAESTALVEAGRKAELQAWPPVVDASSAAASTGIGGIAETVVDQRTTSDGLVALVVTSLAAGGLAVLLAASSVLAGRREEVTEVVRARGAGSRWLVGQRGGEALLLALPGLVVAVALAAWRSPTGLGWREVVVALVAAAVGAVLVTAAQTFRVPGGEQLRIVLRDSVQLGLVLLAGGAVALVVLGGELAPDDPVMLLTAPLLGAAVAVVLMRLLQLALGGLQALARRTSGVLTVVGLSQAAAVSRQVMLPAAALVLAASAGVLAIAVGDSLRAGAERTGWEQVGADVAVTADGLDDDVVASLAGLPGVTDAAAVFTAESVSLDTRGGVEGVTVIGVDPEVLARVGEERLRDLDLRGTDDGAVSAVASPDLLLDDGQATLRYAQSRVPLSVVDRVERIPGVTEGESFVLADRTLLQTAVDRPLDLYSAVLLAGDPDPAAVAEVARARDPQARVDTRGAVAQARLDGAVVARTLAMTRAGVAVSLGLAGFAVLLAVGLGAPVRRRSAAVLGTLGADPRQSRRAGVIGLLPIVAGTCLAAAGCGVVLSVVAGRGFDLATLTDTLASMPVRPSPTSALAVLGALAALVLLAAVAALPRRAAAPDRPTTEHR